MAALDPYIVLLVSAGALILFVAWLPLVLRKLPLSLPMFCIAIGSIAFGYSAANPPDPLRFSETTERLTELVVIVALTGAGLKLDRPFGLRSWSKTWRLLGIGMPLSILAMALIGGWLLGLSIGAALLLGAALAPTDPVLAADVQVGPPRAGEEDEVRFTLTAEAGLNDGLAFPFVNLALAMAVHGITPDTWTWDWLAVDVAWKLGAGLVVGWIVGWALGWLTFHLPHQAKLAQTRDGFVALGVTFVAYGLTELAHGYGFLAVFVAALAIRNAEREHEYHETLHEFAEQTERLLMMVLLVLFGGAIAGGLLAPLSWGGVVAALLFVFVVRPVIGLVSLVGIKEPLRERAAIAFFGIRGLGTFYYLAYALNETHFAEASELWAVVGFTVLLSILVHGTTVTPAMIHLDRQRQPAVP
jgi:NhaP-type Na+/H+ or K+/H+ antiporter